MILKLLQTKNIVNNKRFQKKHNEFSKETHAENRFDSCNGNIWVR